MEVPTETTSDELLDNPVTQMKQRGIAGDIVRVSRGKHILHTLPSGFILDQVVQSEHIAIAPVFRQYHTLADLDTRVLHDFR